eukprot:c45778_g1_i1.p1 GENE.c45778_g1_i1~~c45778_g1_i1.p1  ORF type:complete len:303 (-),score=75.50 c45778_g1_i1:43-924(-)
MKLGFLVGLLVCSAALCSNEVDLSAVEKDLEHLESDISKMRAHISSLIHAKEASDDATASEGVVDALTQQDQDADTAETGVIVHPFAFEETKQSHHKPTHTKHKESHSKFGSDKAAHNEHPEHKEPHGWLDSIFGDEEQPERKTFDFERVTKAKARTTSATHKVPTKSAIKRATPKVGLRLDKLKSAQRKSPVHTTQKKEVSVLESLKKLSETPKKLAPAYTPTVIETLFGVDESNPAVVKAKQDAEDIADAAEEDPLDESGQDDGVIHTKGVLSTLTDLFGAEDLKPTKIRL